MDDDENPKPFIVNCRIGSLETMDQFADACKEVNCRIGSLERLRFIPKHVQNVNCRIGSLETHFGWQ